MFDRYWYVTRDTEGWWGFVPLRRYVIFQWPILSRVATTWSLPWLMLGALFVYISFLLLNSLAGGKTVHFSFHPESSYLKAEEFRCDVFEFGQFFDFDATTTECSHCAWQQSRVPCASLISSTGIEGRKKRRLLDASGFSGTARGNENASGCFSLTTTQKESETSPRIVVFYFIVTLGFAAAGRYNEVEPADQRVRCPRKRGWKDCHESLISFHGTLMVSLSCFESDFCKGTFSGRKFHSNS